MGKGKGGKKGKGKAKPKNTGPAVSHGFYQEQINTQADALDQLRDVHDDEVIKLDEVSILNEQIEQDKGDITSYVHRMIREKELDIDLLNETEKTIIDKDKITNLEHDLTNNFDQHKLEKNDSEIEKLKLVGHLKEMSETSHDKQKIEGQISNHIKILNDESKTFTEQVYQTEKKSLQKRDGIKIEMVHKVRQLTNDFHKLSAAQVSKISKGAIRKNQTMGESLYLSDADAHESINRNRDYETKLNRVLLDSKAYESTTSSNENVLTGTISAFRRENAVRTKKLQDLVVEYRDIEERIQSLDERDADLRAIEVEIEQIRKNSEIKIQNTDITILRADTEKMQGERDKIKRKLDDTNDEFDKMLDIGNRLLRDIQSGAISRRTAKLLLDNSSLELRSQIAVDIRHHYTSGAVNLIPAIPFN